MAVVEVLLTAHPHSVQHKDANGHLLADYTEGHPSLSPLCILMPLIRHVADDSFPPQPPAASSCAPRL